MNRTRPALLWAGVVVLVMACGGGSAPVPPPNTVPTVGPAPAATTAQVDPADAPDPGKIWFGKSFAVDTFKISGRATKFKHGSQVALVAHLSRQSAGEVLGLQLTIGGINASWPGGAIGAGDEFWAQVLPAAELFQTGKVAVRVVDVGGNTLAEGTFTLVK